MHLAKSPASTTLYPSVSVPCELSCSSERAVSCLALALAEEVFEISLCYFTSDATGGSGVWCVLGRRGPRLGWFPESGTALVQVQRQGQPCPRPQGAVSVCAVGQGMLWVCGGTRYLSCRLLASCCKSRRAGWHLHLTPCPVGIAHVFSHANGRRGQCHGLRSPHPRTIPATAESHQPCGGPAGGHRPSPPQTQPSCFAYILGFSKFLLRFCPGTCCCNVSPTQDTWLWPGGDRCQAGGAPKPGSGLGAERWWSCSCLSPRCEA